MLLQLTLEPGVVIKRLVTIEMIWGDVEQGSYVKVNTL